jgi:hypothetical protein
MTTQITALSGLDSSKDMDTLLTQMLTILNKMKSIVDEAHLPSSLQSDVTLFSDNISKVTKTVDAMKTAYDAKDTKALAQAVTDYSSTESGLATSNTLAAYFKDLPNKMHSAATDIKTYSDSIK